MADKEQYLGPGDDIAFAVIAGESNDKPAIMLQWESIRGSGVFVLDIPLADELKVLLENAIARKS